MAKASRTWTDRAVREQAGRDSQLPLWDGEVGLYVVQHKGETKFYLLRLLGSTPESLLLDVLPLGEEVPYQVRVGGDHKQCSCECRGYLSGGYCRHLIGLGEFYRAGVLRRANGGCDVKDDEAGQEAGQEGV